MGMESNRNRIANAHSHTHCQAAQGGRTTQILSKSVSDPTQGGRKIKHESTTMAIRNAGFGGK